MDNNESSKTNLPSPTDKQQLVLAALALDRPGIVSQISGYATDASCNILDSQMTVFGREFGVLMQVEGDQSALNQFKSEVVKFASEHPSIEIITRDTGLKSNQPQQMSYDIQILSLDHPGLVKEVTKYLSDRSINIERLATQTYAAPHTGSTMFSMSIAVSLPPGTSVKSLKSGFLEFCDEINLDATMGPARAR